MTDPIDLNARREQRVPEPDGEPVIRMPMDSDEVIFRDQDALDEYVAGATAALQARCAELERDVKNVTRWAMTRESERDALQATLDRAEEDRDLYKLELDAADAVIDRVTARVHSLANGGSLHGGPQLRWTVADIRDELRTIVTCNCDLGVNPNRFNHADDCPVAVSRAALTPEGKL